MNIKNWERLDSINYSWLVGHSRKSFLTHIVGNNIPPMQRDFEASIAGIDLVNKVGYIRLHNVANFYNAYNIYKGVLS
jgi:dihydropteroate synthase